MSKGQSSKKGQKKEATKSLKEKRAAKKEKKLDKINTGLLSQIHT